MTGRPFETRLTELGRWLDGMYATGARRDDEMRRLGVETQALTGQVGRLTRTVEELDRRFTALLADQHDRDRPDGFDQQDLDQYDRLDALRDLFDRARRIVSDQVRRGQLPAEQEQRARYIRYLMAATGLSEGRPDPSGLPADPDLRDVDLPDLRRRADALRRPVKESGRPPRFVLDVPGPGAPPDPSWQEPWGSCDPDGDVLFAVTPAYLLDDRCLLRQQVFTRSRDAEPAPADPPADPASRVRRP